MAKIKDVVKLRTGYLKLLFPDLQVTDEECVEYCVNPAVRMRQQIRDELARLDQEYQWVTIKSERPDDFQMSHPEEKPESDKAEAPVDNLSLDRKPIESTLNIADGQRGVSYARLFNPYLIGAKNIKLVDPYVRYDYQIHNFLNFCEGLTASDTGLSIELVTGADTKFQENEIATKFDEIKENLAQDRISLTCRFDTTLHDRWIEADTGWRIILGRGLDIFQKPEGKFALGFVDQTKRRCKATTITYTKKG